MPEGARIFQFPSESALAGTFARGIQEQGTIGISEGVLMASYPLSGGQSESATSEAKMATNDDLINAKIAASEAKTDTKFAQILGEIRLISSDLKGEIGKVNTRLDGVERSTSGIKGTVIITGIAAVAVIVAVLIGFLAYGAQWFGIGLTTRDTIRATIREMQEPPALPPPPRSH